jgi:hypothetical protein
MESSSRWRSGRLFALLAAFVLVAVVIAVSSYFIFGSSQDNNPKTTEKNNEPPGKISVSKTANAHPLFSVVGHCARGRGTLFGAGRGFTPGGRYVTIAWYPDGKPYTRIANPGHASTKGTTPNWRWACERVDPPGRYEVRLVDLDTAKMSDLVTFEVSP